jgi:hypothetical protein
VIHLILEFTGSVLESVSSTNVALAESDLSSVVEEQETEGVVVGVVADQAKPEVDEVAPDRSGLKCLQFGTKPEL